jgi:hypothetical protein
VVNFSGDAVSLTGLTLRFSEYTGDYASEIKVAYYDAATGGLIREDTYYPTSWRHVISRVVTGIGSITITFYSTNRPYRRLRMRGIDYGETVDFTGSDIKAASVVEEVDILSSQARYNACSLRLYSNDGDFSIISPSGVYAQLTDRQPIAVYETVDGATVYMGQYYMQKWENQSETQIEFDCVDILGILAKIAYDGNLWAYPGTALSDVLAALLGPLNVGYELDASLASFTVMGWLPICTYRDALQQLAFAAGAYLDCSRSNLIRIIKTPTTSDAATATITRAQKGASQTLMLKPQVTGVEITTHTYSPLTTSKQVFSGALTAGTYKIKFSEPMHTLSATGATIASSGVNYAVLTVASPGTVTLTGQVYEDATFSFSVYATVDARVKPNVITITKATLVNRNIGADVRDRVYAYYQMRLSQKLKLFAPTNIRVGDVVEVETLYGRSIKGIVEKMDIDLFGGMVAQVEITGEAV